MGNRNCDVVVIGAGVIGCCTARELARFDLDVVVLEAALDIASGATRANSGVVHAGYDPEPGTLKARYNVEGAALLPQWQRELGFAYLRNGALVLGFGDDDRATLEKLLERAATNGVESAEIVDAAALREMEPNVSPDATCALHVPTSGICDPYGLTYGAAENAAANGVEFLFDHRVCGIERMGETGNGRFRVAVNGSEAVFEARAVVNAAGVRSDEMNNLVSARKIEIAPRKGQYRLYDNALAGAFQHTMFQAPTERGKGVLVSPVAFGNPFIGPSAEDVDDKDDVSTTSEGLAAVLEQGRRTWPGAPENGVIATYAGLRACDASGAGDFIVGEAEDTPGFFNAACIDSPGLASAPAIAADLANMVALRLGARRRADFTPVRTPAPLLAMMGENDKAALVAENPLYGEEVCRCCHVSEGELVDALHRALPVLSLDALKWRTGATMGPCHGGRCTARIAEIVLRELGPECGELRKRNQGSEMLAPDGGGGASDGIAAIARDAASRIENLLDGGRLREAGAGELGIAGTRPAGIYSAAEAIGLMAATGRLPGRRVVVWGAGEVAQVAERALADAGVEIVRSIDPRTGARVVAASGEGRLSAVTVSMGDAFESVPCDLLVTSPTLFPN